jgi:hypothetical protein
MQYDIASESSNQEETTGVPPPPPLPPPLLRSDGKISSVRAKTEEQWHQDEPDNVRRARFEKLEGKFF